MGRTMWWVGALGWLVFTGAGVQGFGLGNLEKDLTGFQPHLLVGSLGALLIVFAAGWVAIYLVLTNRLLRRTVPGDGPVGAVARSSRWAVPLAVAAAVAAVATTALAVPVFTGRWPTTVHLLLGGGAVVLQAAALAALWPLLGRHEELIRRTDRSLNPAA